MLEQTHRKCLLRRCYHALIEGVREQQILDVKRNSATSFARSNCCRRGLYFLQTAASRSKQIRLGYNRYAQVIPFYSFEGRFDVFCFRSKLRPSGILDVRKLLFYVGMLGKLFPRLEIVLHF